MPTLGPQIVSQSYGNLLKFKDIGEAGVTALQVQITDGKGKVTPLQLATGSVYVSGTLSSSAEVVFSGLTQVTQTNIVCIDGSGRLYFQNSASFQDNDWTVGSTFMTASGQENVYIPNALRQGQDTTTTDDYAHAEGRDTSADTWAHAEGMGSTAFGNYSHAEGQGTRTNGIGSHAEGKETLTVYEGAHAEGIYTTASGEYSHAEGSGSYARDGFSHAEGVETRTFGNGSHAEGYQTLASNNYSHAEGKDTIASGYGSHAEGTGSIASATSSHAEGIKTLASGYASHAEGEQTLASFDADHSEGLSTTASGNYSHAEGRSTLAYGAGSHAEGIYTTSSGWGSHAEGFETRTTGFNGWGVIYICQHAEGYKTLADKNFSHAEGMNTTASGEGSHAGGYNTNARYDNQTVVGHCNDDQVQDKTEDVFVVGVGTDTNRQSGLRVRKPEGKVILNQTPNITTFQDYIVATIPTSPGLYFGEPETAGTTRINSVVNVSGNGSVYIQEYDGSTYNNMVQVKFNATASFSS